MCVGVVKIDGSRARLRAHTHEPRHDNARDKTRHTRKRSGINTQQTALLTGDAVRNAFDELDSDGNGTVDRDEFRNGFALLTSDSARAEA